MKHQIKSSGEIRYLIAFLLVISGFAIVSCNSDYLDYKEGFIQANGVSHYYKIAGKGEPFIILHGGPGMYHDELYPFFQDFAKSHKVIFYDQRGNGKSVMETIDSSNFTVELMVEDLEELRKQLGLERINVIGHSWGGLLAMYYAVEYPDHVNRLILVDSAPVNTELLIKCYEKQITMLNPGEWEYLQKLWNSEDYLAGKPEVHNEAMRISERAVFSNKDVFNDYMKVAAFDEAKAKNAVALNELATKMKLNIHVQNRLSNITCPTLIINGKDDFIVEEAPYLTNRLIANSKMVFIEGAGHYPFIENREDFFRELNSFINSTRPKNIYKK